MMKKTLIYFFCVLSIIGGIYSCNPLAVQGPEPAFIDIPSIEFIHDLDKGPRLHRIEHVEIFFENFSIGYYELPVNIAVIPTQEVSNVSIRPAIRLNGEANRITNYVMMTPFNLSQTFEVGETYEIIPQFDYVANIEFDYIESFEVGNTLNFDLDEIDTSFTQRVSTGAAEGVYSGLLSSENSPYIEVATNDPLFSSLNNGGRAVFVEFDYKCNTDFEFGLTGVGNSQSLNFPFIQIQPKDDWRKIYLEITNVILIAPAPAYRMYFKLDATGVGIPSEIFIDNLKLLHIP